MPVEIFNTVSKFVSKRSRFSRSAGKDLEKGLQPAGKTSHGASAQALQDAPASEPEKLVEFRNLVGIESNSDLNNKGRPAPNLGIYYRTVCAEKSSNRWYTFWAILVNACLGIQVIVAAALTAIGASGQTERAAIVVLGAINTAIAGFLTYLKGSGLPNRMRYYASEWTKLREYIEQRERDFGEEKCELKVSDEVTTIEKMYESVRADVDANIPDKFVGVSQRQINKGGVQPLPLISEPASNSTPSNPDEKKGDEEKGDEKKGDEKNGDEKKGDEQDPIGLA
jgi:hypothetical protein